METRSHSITQAVTDRHSMQYYHKSIGMANIQSTDKTKHCRMWSNRNSHLLMVGMKNATATLEDSLAVSYKTYHVTQQLCFWCILKCDKNLCRHKNLHVDVSFSLIHIFQHLEAIKMSLSRWMDKLWYHFHTMKYYSALKRKEISGCEKTWKKLNLYY